MPIINNTYVTNVYKNMMCAPPINNWPSYPKKTDNQGVLVSKFNYLYDNEIKLMNCPCCPKEPEKQGMLVSKFNYFFQNGIQLKVRGLNC